MTPFGDIIVDSAHGMFMGNRGGRIHNPDKTLTNRRWAGSAWIICLTAFKGRKRELMAPNSYTELFFLDEATALAAGHRPCGECRRSDLKEFMTAWDQAWGTPEKTPLVRIDRCLHSERVSRSREQITYLAEVDGLPDGVFVAVDGRPYLVRGDALLLWTTSGYVERRERPNGCATLVTPRSTVGALAAGYAPAIHPSADQF